MFGFILHCSFYSKFFVIVLCVWFSTALQLVFDELLERVKEKEEKEAKKRKRLADDFSHLLSSIKV